MERSNHETTNPITNQTANNPTPLENIQANRCFRIWIAQSLLKITNVGCLRQKALSKLAILGSLSLSLRLKRYVVCLQPNLCSFILIYTKGSHCEMPAFLNSPNKNFP